MRTLAAHKGGAPVLLKVNEYCSFADYFLICSGNSRRHVLALAQHVEEALARTGLKPLGIEGLEEGQWVLMDYNIMVIHIFLQPLREFYNLEDLWSEAPKLQIDADTVAPTSSFSSPEPLSDADKDVEPIRHE
ncbi:MAG: ribosome silencing factor [Deltaproteobacteria bacterium]|jgi:ribosome-associated protein